MTPSASSRVAIIRASSISRYRPCRSAAIAIRERAARRFKDFRYRTRDSWSCARHVVAKAEQLPGGSGETCPNPRFVVTSLSLDERAPKSLYERLYYARGEMENRIKECRTHPARTASVGIDGGGESGGERSSLVSPVPG